MKKVKLGELAKVIVSGVDKKTKEGETIVKLCNFVDVYYNWAITVEQYDSFMEASARDAEIEKFSIGKGQVAITKDSETRYDIGIPTYIADDFDGVLLGYHCALITPNNDLLNGKYLNALLNTDYAKEYFANNATGSGQRYTISEEIIKSFPIPLIPIDEQKKIGDYLSDIDSKLTNNRKQNAILEKMAKQIYDYWFVQFDFPDENGRPYKSSGGKMVWNETLKREIPEGWEVKDIDSLCSFNNRSLTTRTMPNRMLYLDTSNLTQNRITELQELTSNFPSRARRLVQNKTILYSTVRPNLCHYGILINPDNELVVSTGFATIDVNDEDILSPYMLYSYLTTPSNVQYLHNIAVNAVSSYPSINPSDIGQMNLAIPYNTSLMKDYNSRVADIYFEINTNCNEIKHLSELRSYLLPLLMTGQAKLS